MSAPNKYFDNPTQRPEHPRVRAWKAYRKRASVDHVEVEVLRERDGLNLLPARLFVSFVDADGAPVGPMDEVLWEAELENWLIDEEKAKTREIANEKLRFALLLKPAMRPILLRHGDGYFNAVLVGSLREGPFGEDAQVADMLRSIHEIPPAEGSREDCQELIEHALSMVAKRILSLYLDRTVAEDILAGAIAQYLDDRFSVTNSRMLGLDRGG